MPRLLPMRSGTELKAYERSVPFSFWPTAPGVPRPKIQSTLFVIDPWVIMRRAVTEQVQANLSRSEALSYIAQAEDFYTSALSSNIHAARPVQLYYSYLNVAKAFIICRGVLPSLGHIQHGLNEAITANGQEFLDAYVQFWTSPNPRQKRQAFDEFMRALDFTRLPDGQQNPIVQLVPQILSGHRLWAAAADQRERFIAFQQIKFVETASQS